MNINQPLWAHLPFRVLFNGITEQILEEPKVCCSEVWGSEAQETPGLLISYYTFPATDRVEMLYEEQDL